MVVGKGLVLQAPKSEMKSEKERQKDLHDGRER